jgi:hypothetical protein
VAEKESLNRLRIAAGGAVEESLGAWVALEHVSGTRSLWMVLQNDPST